MYADLPFTRVHTSGYNVSHVNAGAAENLPGQPNLPLFNDDNLNLLLLSNFTVSWVSFCVYSRFPSSLDKTRIKLDMINGVLTRGDGLAFSLGC